MMSTTDVDVGGDVVGFFVVDFGDFVNFVVVNFGDFVNFVVVNFDNVVGFVVFVMFFGLILVVILLGFVF
jgi:hypothetical protein